MIKKILLSFVAIIGGAFASLLIVQPAFFYVFKSLSLDDGTSMVTANLVGLLLIVGLLWWVWRK